MKLYICSCDDDSDLVVTADNIYEAARLMFPHNNTIEINQAPSNTHNKYYVDVSYKARNRETQYQDLDIVHVVNEYEIHNHMRYDNEE